MSELLVESSCHISTFKYFESEYVANSLFLEIREFYENQKNDNNENKGMKQRLFMHVR